MSARVPVLSQRARHVVSRFTFGTTPRLVDDVRRHGLDGWLDRQLRPDAIADDRAAALDDWWPQLWLGPQELWQRHTSGVQPSWELMRDYGSWLLTRRIRTRRQVFEVMVAFWENHLHIAHSSDAFTWRADYGRTLREHALGRYDDLLVAAVTHPAMLIWLDGANSVKTAPNENLGRELLELFTLGVGRYTEDDVKDAAKVLTGWRVDKWHTWALSYRSTDHYVGPVQVADFTHPNADPDGRAVTEALLRHLARHPATARTIARRLATKFVRDDPSEALVSRLAAVYLANDTAIVPVLRALLAAPEFAAAAGLKLRDPVEDLVATCRALGADFQQPGAGRAATEAIVWQTMDLGQLIGDWPRPDGMPLENRPWATTLRALASTTYHRLVAHGWWPSRDIGATYRPDDWWAPRLPIRYDALVDHVSRVILGRPATDALLDAACLALEVSREERIDADHAVVTWRMGDVLTTVLDTPAHYHR
ncbi:MAG TPA: DUF1800 domain-containing protein [Nocardioides sp.]|nr:DUF1800 domain-containing protein [Nocardioides sp.]